MSQLERAAARASDDFDEEDVCAWPMGRGAARARHPPTGPRSRLHPLKRRPLVPAVPPFPLPDDPPSGHLAVLGVADSAARSRGTPPVDYVAQALSSLAAVAGRQPGRGVRCAFINHILSHFTPTTQPTPCPGRLGLDRWCFCRRADRAIVVQRQCKFAVAAGRAPDSGSRSRPKARYERRRA